MATYMAFQHHQNSNFPLCSRLSSFTGNIQILNWNIQTFTCNIHARCCNIQSIKWNIQIRHAKFTYNIRTCTLNKPSSYSIDHVRYINILAWLRGFRVKLWKTKETWPESPGAMLEYWYIERGLFQLSFRIQTFDYSIEIFNNEHSIETFNSYIRFENSTFNSNIQLVN